MGFVKLDIKGDCQKQVNYYSQIVKYTKQTVKLNAAKKALKYWSLLLEGKWYEAGEIYGYNEEVN